MKIKPISCNQVRIETETGSFDIYELTDGGLEIVSEADKVLVVDVPTHSTRAVIHVAEKPVGLKK